MDSNPSIWIEIGQASNISKGQVNLTRTGLPIGGFFALFAARILLRSFDELTGWKWGFSQEALLREARDRQQLFIEAHHYAEDQGVIEPPDQRTLTLRIVNQPGNPNLQIILLGKIFVASREEARTKALEYWHEISSQFPYDYAIAPIEDQKDFNTISNSCSSINEITSTGACIEITRSEGILQPEKASLYAMGMWNSTLTSNEKIWRILASCPSEVMLNITLRPTIYYEEEISAIAQITERAATLAHESTNPVTRQDAELIQTLYLDRLKNMRYAYLAQLHVLSPCNIPEYIPRAIGSALTHHKLEHSKELGYQMCRPKNKRELLNWLDAIYWLEPFATSGIVNDVRLQRLRYLVNSAEASTLFQLPFPSKGGIFGVNFEYNLPKT